MTNDFLRLSFVFLISAGSLIACSEPVPPPAELATDEQQGNEHALEIGTPITAVTPAPDAPEENSTSEKGSKEIEWDDLIPADYRPDKIMEKYDLENMADDDPRADELQKELQALWDQAPVRPEMDGRAVKIPGFVVPVETDAEETTGFLLVPYYGACIHVPPPPANQTIYVVTEKGKGTKPKTFDVVWVAGDMSVQRIENDVAEAGYTIYASEVKPYE